MGSLRKRFEGEKSRVHHHAQYGFGSYWLGRKRGTFFIPARTGRRGGKGGQGEGNPNIKVYRKVGGGHSYLLVKNPPRSQEKKGIQVHLEEGKGKGREMFSRLRVRRTLA